METDKNGYPIGRLEHSNLIHRQIAYREIYLKNREDYPLPFRKYQVHHKDRNKRNFSVDNLQLVQKEEHRRIHNLPPENEYEENWLKKQERTAIQNEMSYYNPKKSQSDLKIFIIILVIIGLVLCFIFLKFFFSLGILSLCLGIYTASKKEDFFSGTYYYIGSIVCFMINFLIVTFPF